MPGDVKLTLILDGSAKERVMGVIKHAVARTFSEDIRNEAVKLSPVSDTWPSLPEQRGEKRIDTGHNKRTIWTETWRKGGQIMAKIYTQSGYGGYLELGYKVHMKEGPQPKDTRHVTNGFMQGRPYLWPAFRQNVGLISTRVRDRLKKMGGRSGSDQGDLFE